MKDERHPNPGRAGLGMVQTNRLRTDKNPAGIDAFPF